VMVQVTPPCSVDNVLAYQRTSWLVTVIVPPVDNYQASERDEWGNDNGAGSAPERVSESGYVIEPQEVPEPFEHVRPCWG
jgi:hypothetical protein